MCSRFAMNGSRTRCRTISPTRTRARILAGKWIIEMGEIAQFKRSEVETVKSFLSCQIDRFRPPYGRSDISVPRQCVCVGTTNATTYFSRSPGNRRFWPVKITAIQLDEVREDAGDLWAEAVAALRGWRALVAIGRRTKPTHPTSGILASNVIRGTTPSGLYVIETGWPVLHDRADSDRA